MKTYLLDTNIFISNPYCIDDFYANGDNVVVIYRGVLDELDNLKTHQQKGYYARKAIHEIYKHVKNFSAIIIDSDVTLSVDDTLVNLAKELDYILVTQDKVIHIKALMEGVECQDYERVKVAGLPDWRQGQNLQTEYVKEIFGITPKDESQMVALTALCDPQVPLVCLTGAAGTGKNLLSLAAGVECVIRGNYERIYVTRVPVPNTVDIGYLPGGIEEKMTPWLGGINDNLSYIFSHETTYTQGFLEKHIKILSSAHMKGSSIRKGYIIIDEAQDIHPSDMKMLITRVGVGTKIVLLGDVNQITAPYLSKDFNGLSLVVNKLFGEPLMVYVNLETPYRSPLAELAIRKL